MASIPINDIKQAMKLTDYIERNHPEIRLHKSGDLYKGRCPFHKEDTPSFVVYPNSNSFFCFGECNCGGSNIDFVMKTSNVDFKEACKMLAQESGIHYEEGKTNPVHENYKNLMTDHSRRYWKELQTRNDVLEYLLCERHLTIDSINLFRLGFVPTNEYKNRTDQGGIAGRIAFPILENKDIKYSKCIGMGYRKYSSSDTGPKYINDKNHADDNDPLKGVFIKSDILYGYPWAHQAIRQMNYAIIVEGYMDVISMHQAGVLNTVGSLGTAITENQMDLIRKMTRNIILFLDGDKAGVDNMLRVLPTLYDKDFNVKILIATNDMDAADVCIQNSFDTAKVRSYITHNSKPAIMVVMERATKEYEQIVIKERLKAIQQISPLLEKINPMEREVYKDILLKRLDMKGGI